MISFLKNCQKGSLPEREVKHQIEIEPGSKPPYQPPYRLGPAEQDELEEQVKDLLAQGFIRPSCSPYGAQFFCCPRRTADGECVLTTGIEQTNDQGIAIRCRG